MAEEQEQAQTEEKAWKSSFTEDGVTYAASLFWQSLLNPNSPQSEVKDAAENILEGADLYVVRKGKSAQFGLAASSQGFAKGIPSAAVALVSSLGSVTSFLGVFKVDTGWWYICYRNDVILSDGDTLFINEKEAKDQFISMLAVPDWDALFAPAEWAIEGTNTDPLSKYIGKGIQAKLDKINANNDGIMLAAIVVGFAVILWYGYTSLQDMLFTAPEAPIIAPVEQAEPQAVQQLAPEGKPWEELPSPVDLMQNCYNATRKVIGITTPGWKIEGITCNANGLVTSWHREMGRITWMDQALVTSGVQFSSKVIDQSGNTFMVTVPIGNVSTWNSPPEFNHEDLNNIINDINQTLNINLQTAQKTWTSPRGTLYNILEFSLSSKNDPLVWLDFFIKFSGLTITEITYNINDGTWNYIGEIYEL